MKIKREGIYTTHGQETKLIAIKAKVNGVLSLAFVKDGRLLSYEPWEDVSKQMFTGPCMEFDSER